MSIKNFIIIKYKKDKLDMVVATEQQDLYLNCQDSLFDKMILQIRHHYPESNIHVLTNYDFKCDGVIFHKINFKPNHCCKFLLYSLLDEPAMYIDCDVLMLRRFNESELETVHPFKFYNISRQLDLSKISKNISGALTIYNAGIIWIPRPDKKITQDMQQIESDFFSDKDFCIKNEEWPYNDENAASLYVRNNNIYFEKSDTVGVIEFGINQSVQSIHYTGLENKRYFEEDYRRFYLRKQFL